MGLSELRVELPDIDPAEIADAMEKLKARRLLFSERDRFMSLAIDNSGADENRYDRQFGREPDQTLRVAV